MSLFVVVAALLTLAALGALIYPLLRQRPDAPPAWPLVSVLLLLVAGGGAALYPVWSNWNWSESTPAADSPAAMVGRLARRLEKQPDDLAGWLLLGRSYGVIEQFSLSARAYQRADKLANGSNAEALMGLGDALINGGLGDFSGPAGRMFEKALEIEPNSVKALFYSAIAARERNELPVARERFARLLEADPPQEVRQVIEEQLRAVDAMAVMVGKGAGGAAAAAATAGAVATAGAAAAAPAGTAAAVSIPLRITLSAAVAGKANAGAPLFVLARIPGQRGMPLVAKRLDAKFPQQVELLSTDAAMGGSGFTAGQELEIEARVANGGSAISRSGDPFGVVRVKAGAKGPFSIEINQLKP
jgi:cytochrome c-type biogenesis protein CcmH